ncbi:hypothetical protein GS597_00575 [Synechococcales cyanobacterium C]|uniref:Uncharacterized protein n=1 Tax=Petrachloros mirabilis ULC683 TaxID=2781853 RepID=A0A8K1ZVV0_9CYAN|nr:hypothetical protein [Petrachloros mirabilis]NCJ05036.1 hypothetical protein [Petrachloros mirabilis ULC683]
MNFWPDHLWQIIETITQDAEQVLWEVAQGIEAIATEVDDLMMGVLEPIFSIWDWEEDDRVLHPFDLKEVDANFHRYSACIGCQHYHGQAYGGHFLVCAMHPYGVEDNHCPDWESLWGSAPPARDRRV